MSQRHFFRFLPVMRVCVKFEQALKRVAWYSQSKQTAKYVKPQKGKGTIERVRHFVDYAEVTVRGGNGGNGMMSLSALPNLEWAGPDGGNGGNGGHVIFKVSHNAKSLAHLKPIITAPQGIKGKTSKRDGKNASHLTIEVPRGTVIKSKSGHVLASLDEVDAIFIAARGGAGGKGNYFFLSNENRAPMMVEKGGAGQERELHVELKTMAHAGLIGFPNAGKSSLLRVISRAQPKVSPYPFTTLNPHIGMVLYDDHQQLAVADIPGLIPGSHLNKGMGHSFLRHIERCLCLIYVIDLALEKPWQQLQQLRYELNQYKPGLADRPALLIGNKIDLPGAQNRMDRLKEWMKNENERVNMNKKNEVVSEKSEEIMLQNGGSYQFENNASASYYDSDIKEINLSRCSRSSSISSCNRVNFDVGEKYENKQVPERTPGHSQMSHSQRQTDHVNVMNESQKNGKNEETGEIEKVSSSSSSGMSTLGISAKHEIGIGEFVHHLRVICDSHSFMSENKIG